MTASDEVKNITHEKRKLGMPYVQDGGVKEGGLCRKLSRGKIIMNIANGLDSQAA